jgi:hypothetical protein
VIHIATVGLNLKQNKNKEKLQRTDLVNMYTKREYIFSF